jgi:hypothetical protein
MRILGLVKPQVGLVYDYGRAQTSAKRGGRTGKFDITLLPLQSPEIQTRVMCLSTIKTDTRQM